MQVSSVANLFFSCNVLRHLLLVQVPKDNANYKQAHSMSCLMYSILLYVATHVRSV